MENENIEEKYELRMLREEYERELIRYHTNNFVMSTLKELNVNKMKSLDSQSSENVADAISQLHLADYDHNGVKILGKSILILCFINKKDLNQFIYSFCRSRFKSHRIELLGKEGNSK